MRTERSGPTSDLELAARQPHRDGPRSGEPALVQRRHHGGAGAGSAGLGQSGAALPDHEVDGRAARTSEADVHATRDPGLDGRAERRRPGRIGAVEDHGVRVAHGHPERADQLGAQLEVLGTLHPGPPHVDRDRRDAGGASVHRAALRAAVGLDDELPVEPARLGEVAGHAPDAVAAHGRDRAVRVVDVHVGHAAVARRQHGEHPIGADSPAAIAEPDGAVGRHELRPLHHDEVVAEAVILPEVERHAGDPSRFLHPQKRAIARP